MAYHIAQTKRGDKSKPYAVIKTATGEIMGFHSDRLSASDQLGRLAATETGVPLMLRHRDPGDETDWHANDLS